MNAITSQRKQLYKLFNYNKETEAIHVQHITGDESKTTASQLSISEASKLISSLTTNWAVFDRENQQHLYILSLMRQLKWITMHEKYGKEVADMSRLSNFLKSKRSPVPKPLQKMTVEETSKIIFALENIIKSEYAK